MNLNSPHWGCVSRLPCARIVMRDLCAPTMSRTQQNIGHHLSFKTQKTTSQTDILKLRYELVNKANQEINAQKSGQKLWFWSDFWWFFTILDQKSSKKMPHAYLPYILTDFQFWPNFCHIFFARFENRSHQQTPSSHWASSKYFRKNCHFGHPTAYKEKIRHIWLSAPARLLTKK